MLNDRDEDKFEGHEESEYHFSDDEVNYELEEETPKPEVVTTPEAGKSLMSRLTGSRRMLIVLGVFLALVFVMYKMLSPSQTATDITSAPPVVAQRNATPTPVMKAPQANSGVVPVASPASPIAVNPTVAPANQPPSMAQPVASTENTNISASPAMQMAQQLAQSQGVSQPVQTTTMPKQTIQPPAAVANSASQNPPAANFPAVIPVQSAVPTSNPTSYSGVNNIDANISALAGESQRVANQLQGQYAQQFNDFSNQNKMVQQQIQSLSARVSTMENQLNQLIQVLTRRAQNTSMTSPPTQSPMMVHEAAPASSIAYNVQAIIPGRAWLKSDNGETLTVAEGDVIKGVGRVTKIDPYDGIVEINTGTKAVSLSYGNGS